MIGQNFSFVLRFLISCCIRAGKKIGSVNLNRCTKLFDVFTLLYVLLNQSVVYLRVQNTNFSIIHDDSRFDNLKIIILFHLSWRFSSSNDRRQSILWEISIDVLTTYLMDGRPFLSLISKRKNRKNSSNYCWYLFSVSF